MTILETITDLDLAYEPIEGGVIDAIGVTADGKEVHVWIYNAGDGPLIEPGPWFLPYGGIYFNPLLVSVRAAGV